MMRIVAVIADAAMGMILGIFIYVALSRTWRGLEHPIVAGVVLVASLLLVMFRRPHGSLAKWWQGSALR